MSQMTDKEIDELPDAELLTVPGDTFPPGWLTTFFTRRATALYQSQADELVREMDGDSTRHLMIAAGIDPHARHQREEDEARRAWQAEQEMILYRQRMDRLLVQLDEQQRLLTRRRQEIEDKALKLHDGRRVYVDGEQYRDEHGNVLQGRDRDEAAGQHRQHPDASTWRDKKDIDDQFAEMERLKRQALKDREGVERVLTIVANRMDQRGRAVRSERRANDERRKIATFSKKQ